MEIREKLKNIILGIVDQEEYDLQLEDNLEDILGYTSVDYIQMIAEIEEQFDIEFDIEDLDLECYNTYGSLIDLVKKKIK